jgi:hypothetical protein
MGVGEVVDTGIRLARRNYRLLAMTTAYAVAPAFVLGAILNLVLGFTAPVTIVILIGEWWGGLATITACSHLIVPSGDLDELRPSRLYHLARGRMWRSFLWVLVVVALAIPLTILFPLGIYLGVRWAQSWCAVVIEGDGPIQSLRRSWKLTRRAWWHSLGALFVSGVIFGLANVVVGGLFGAIGALVLVTGSVALGGLVSSLGGVVSAIFVAPFSVATYVVLYYELRARDEGFDLESRAQSEWQPT